MRSGMLALGVVVGGALAHAQPVTAPDTAPLAELRDDKQLAQALVTLTQDPAIRVEDPKARPRAAALMAEGVRQLQASAYDQALANFLEAYSEFPSPKILLNIASTLRDMGRLADAANTYQRYLGDPATGPERVAEVKQILVDLDQQLTVLTIHVSPKGSEISIDGGPFIPVGSALVTRVRPGIHLVRIRKGDRSHEQTINGFEGELKDVIATLPEPTTPAPTQTAPLPTVRTPEAEPADQVFGWLDTGTQYGTDDATSRKRQVRTGYGGPVVRAYVPERPRDDDPPLYEQPREPERRIHSGLLGLVRVDGKGRGLAGGLGLALATADRFELELAVLRSNQWGGYAGARARFLTGWVRPYVAGGVPAFLYDDENEGMQTKLAVAVRGAAGVELRINDHLSVKGDVGLEHFFLIDEEAIVGGKRPERTVLVPTLGMIGRL